MPKRKKHPRLPNGYGSIKYLGSNRRNPYAVHPPTKEFTVRGVPKTPKALCYVDDWTVGFAVLTAYKAGTYVEGMEKDLKPISETTNDVSSLAEKILADYNRYRRQEADEPPQRTFTEVYEAFYSYKYNGKRKYSESAKKATRTAYKHCEPLWNKTFCDLRYADLQKIVDECPLKHASLEHIVSLFKQMYTYALLYEIVDTDYSSNVSIDIPDDDEHGEPFTLSDLKYLWKRQNDETIEFLLIMCYSGFRISEYETLEVNLEEGYFCGGIKTEAGKDRVVPIHSAILPLVNRRIVRDGCILNCPTARMRKRMYRVLDRAGLPKHTPHDCRHTFSMLCERFEVRENDQKRMLGHAFKDVTNKVYGHRNLEDLKREIEKIKVPYRYCTRQHGSWHLVTRTVIRCDFKYENLEEPHKINSVTNLLLIKPNFSDFFKCNLTQT